MTSESETRPLRLRLPRYRLCVAPEFVERVRRAGLDADDGFDRSMDSGQRIPGGRGPNRNLDAATPSIRLRPNRHGGLLAAVLGDRYLRPTRPFREFENWTTLRARGVCLPAPVLAVSRRRGLFWHSAFGSLERSAARDGAEWLATRPGPAARRAACITFACTLRRLHDVGGVHGDLNLRNVLIESDEGDSAEPALRCVLVDLDRSRILHRVSPRRRVRELMRFARSLEKAGHAELASPRARALVFSAYCAGDRSLRRAMQRWIAIETFRLSRHRMGWRIARRSGRLNETPQR